MLNWRIEDQNHNLHHQIRYVLVNKCGIRKYLKTTDSSRPHKKVLWKLYHKQRHKT